MESKGGNGVHVGDVGTLSRTLKPKQGLGFRV